MLALHLQHGHVPAAGELRRQCVTAPAALPRAPAPRRAPRNRAAASPHPHAKRNRAEEPSGDGDAPKGVPKAEPCLPAGQR